MVVFQLKQMRYYKRIIKGVSKGEGMVVRVDIHSMFHHSTIGGQKVIFPTAYGVVVTMPRLSALAYKAYHPQKKYTQIKLRSLW